MQKKIHWIVKKDQLWEPLFKEKYHFLLPIHTEEDRRPWWQRFATAARTYDLSDGNGPHTPKVRRKIKLIG